jgi:signal transduction histidine kinase/CheY-like chemotaxis protein
VYVPVVPEILRGKVQVLAELHRQRKKLERLYRNLEQANAKLAEAHSSLQAERSRELQALNRTLERANLGLAEANAALETENAERRRVEDALREADRRKDEFLATLSHELRNPLAAIANAIQYLQLAKPDDEGLGAAHDVLGRQVAHLTRLIDDLLDISRITMGRIALRRERVDLADAVSRALETIRPLVDERRQSLVVRLPDPPVTLDADPVRIAQIVANLVTNAVKYTDDGGRIEIAAGRTERDGAPCALVAVKDSGIGIAPEVLPHVFNLFSQAQPGTRDNGSGLGIGLALVRELVGLHGGDVRASSDGAGKGAEFVVRLPLAAEPALAVPAPAARAGPSRAGTQARRVLVVDDNRDSAESLAALLGLLGHDVRQAYDGQGGLDLARSWVPDLVLLDLGMPGMNGHEVARRLRAEARLLDTTLVALTGYGSAEDRRASREAGFDWHLVKPIDFEALEGIFASVPPQATVRRPEAA